MNVNNNPPPEIKEAMLLAFAGLFQYQTQPLSNLDTRRVHGFWLRDGLGTVTQVWEGVDGENPFFPGCQEGSPPDFVDERTQVWGRQDRARLDQRRGGLHPR